MPIYEFYCQDCHTIFNFFSSRVNTRTTPGCPNCQRLLKRQVSLFSTVGRAKEEDAGMPDIDEGKMERVLGDLAREAENINEDDPRQMARIMRRFSEQSGMNLGDGMEEALRRLESGEDPEAVEQAMGDIMEGEEPFALKASKAKGRARSRPRRDETLYELREGV
ncbi:MAG: zinc ribbon domain-containing protein [Desulfobacteraceae bacterium]|nr:zinc ribbon domain-containing protein [Desulfobacteraceae bacterium]